MPSPFPGIDPYLEDSTYWSGFHTRMVVAIGAAITRVLPSGYYADVEQHVWLETDDGDERTPFAIPDAFVASGRGGGVATLARELATPESAVVSLAKVIKRKGPRFLQIVDKHGSRLVTVLELLSPSNKNRGEDRESYLAKRSEYLANGTNLVEIDLLRDGERIPMGRPRPPLADYYALVSRSADFPKASIWAISVREPLPRIPIPLKPEHGEVILDLQTCFGRAFDDAGYETRIDYSFPPAVGLRPADAAWAMQLIGPVVPEKREE